jgi:hypothetical protein
VKGTPIIVIALLIGFALGLLVGYRLKPIQTTMFLAPYSGKVIPYVHDGEILKWKGMKVTVAHGGGLCENSTEKDIDTCVVKKGIDQLQTIFKVICPGVCNDPDFGGGSGVVPPFTAEAVVAGQPAAAPTPPCTPATCAEIDVYCDTKTNTTMVDPSDTVPIDKSERIFWVPNGANTQGLTAGPGLTPVCGADTIPGLTACTILGNAPARTSYQVSLSACGAPVTAYVNIKQ